MNICINMKMKICPWKLYSSPFSSMVSIKSHTQCSPPPPPPALLHSMFYNKIHGEFIVLVKLLGMSRTLCIIFYLISAENRNGELHGSTCLRVHHKHKGCEWWYCTIYTNYKCLRAHTHTHIHIALAVICDYIYTVYMVIFAVVLFS